MTNIVKFPRVKRTVPKQPPDALNQTDGPTPKLTDKSENESALIQGTWVVTVLVWPILKWIMALDCVYQMVRMMYHWHTPGVFAGFTFLMHFGVFVSLTYFVSIYKPKNL